MLQGGQKRKKKKKKKECFQPRRDAVGLRGSERESHPPKITQPVNGRVRGTSLMGK